MNGMELCGIKEQVVRNGSDERGPWCAGCKARGVEGSVNVDRRDNWGGGKKKVERYLGEKCESKIFTSFIPIHRSKAHVISRPNKKRSALKIK